jgi:hypothetical protein
MEVGPTIVPESSDIREKKRYTIATGESYTRSTCIVYATVDPSSRMSVEHLSFLSGESPDDLHRVHEVEASYQCSDHPEMGAQVSEDDEFLCSSESMDVGVICLDELVWSPLFGRGPLSDIV